MKNWLIIIILLLILCVGYAEDIIVDNTPPIVLVTTPTTTNPAYNRSGQSVRIEFNYTENNPANYTITIYNTSLIVCNKTVGNETGGNLTSGNVTIVDSCTLPSVDDGYFNLTVNMTDLVGNSSTATEIDSVIVDTVAPTIVYSEPVNNSDVITSTVDMIVNTSEIAECRYSQYSGTNFTNMTLFPNTNSIQHTVVLATDEAGTYVFYIKCKDPSNNVMDNDYIIAFNVSFNFTVTGRTVYLGLAFHVGDSKSDDVYRFSKNYFASYDSSGVVIGIVPAGNPIGTALNKSYNSSNALANIYQSLENNRFIITFTKGDSSTVSVKLYQTSNRNVPSKTFGVFSPRVPTVFPATLDLDYDDIDITSSASWSGSGSLLIKNNGLTDKGLPNITLEVIV